MGGFLVFREKLSPRLLHEFKPYIKEIVEVSEEEVENLMRPPENGNGLKEGGVVEVTRGTYQGFSGILRKILEDRVMVDLNLFGRVIAVEVSAGDVKESKVSGPWM